MLNIFKQINLLVLILFTVSAIAAAPVAPDCSQVLGASSDKFIEQYSSQNGGNGYSVQDAIKLYSDCYTSKINVLSNWLAKSGRGPLMGANGDFHDMENALNTFTKTALAATAGGGSYDAIKAAYAYLYALQFSYDFYEQYVHPEKNIHDDDHSSDVLKANSYLQDSIDKLPENRREGVQASFYAFETAAVRVNGLSILKVYQYAIFILQSPEDQPYSPPPF